MTAPFRPDANAPATLPFPSASASPVGGTGGSIGGDIGGDIGLDLGTTAFRSLCRENGRLVGRREVAAYTVLPRRPEPQRLLQSAGIPFSRVPDGLIVVGQAAVDVAASFESPLVPLMPGGELPLGDPIGRQVAAMLLESVLGPQQSRSGRVCVMTVPGSPGPQEDTPTLLFFSQMVKLAGLVPQVVHSGAATAAASFTDRSLRGIGVSIGASHTDVAIIVRGYETGWHRIPIGGDTVDARLIDRHKAYLHDRHGDRFPDFLSVRRWKESPDRSLLNRDAAGLTLAESYGDVTLSAARAVVDLLQHHRETGTPRPLPCVVSGGPTAMAGFEPLWTQALRGVGLLDQLGEVRIEPDAEYEVARGLLLYTEAGTRMAA